VPRRSDRLLALSGQRLPLRNVGLIWPDADPDEREALLSPIREYRRRPRPADAHPGCAIDRYSAGGRWSAHRRVTVPRTMPLGHNGQV
jgi:hypothetical protein